MKNIQELRDRNQCTGCCMCTAVCPQNAITMDISEYGFLEPQVCRERCNGCGRCVNFCIVNHSGVLENIRDKVIFSYKAPSNHLKLLCSSGGFSLALAFTYLQKGYFFIGASFANGFKDIHHVICENPMEIFNTIGSKYIQSDMSDVLSKIWNRGTGSKYVIVGTPCQIAGLRKVIDEKGASNQFVLVDFFCHGVPSYLLWWKYIRDIERKIGLLIHYEFRNNFESWHEFRVRAIGEKGFYSQFHQIDPYMYLYLKNFCFRNACYSCNYRNMSAADIRMGDFWGLQFQDDKVGVSIAIPLNERGTKVFNEVAGFKEKIADRKFETNVDFQKPPIYEQFLNELKNNDFQMILKRYHTPMLKKRSISGILKKISGKPG